MTIAMIDLIPLAVGGLTMPESYFLRGATDMITVPVTAYLLVHPKGLAVFDTGLGPRFSRPDGAPLVGSPDLEESHRVDSQVRSAGFDPYQVETIVNSHLHTDHAGGNVWLPNAEILVQEVEWQYATEVGGTAYHRPEFDTGQRVRTVAGEVDLFNDGSAVVYPTPGHTPGHQSLRVMSTGGPAVLAGDACNLRASLEELWLPDEAHDLDAYRTTLEHFVRRKNLGDEIFFSHDPQFWASIDVGRPWGVPGRRA
jgi:N-acyl homoserine lactone hydrolase